MKRISSAELREQFCLIYYSLPLYLAQERIFVDENESTVSLVYGHVVYFRQMWQKLLGDGAFNIIQSISTGKVFVKALFQNQNPFQDLTKKELD